MNKQELIKHFEEMEYVSVSQMGKKAFIDLIEQLDEPQKVKVPQFVADWIEYCKNTFLSLACALAVSEEDFYSYANQKDHLDLLYFLGSMINQEKFARAWLDGYEVEKEKRYYVRLKNVDENYNYLTCIKHLNAWVLTEIKKDKKFRMTHTRKQLEDADFGWVFDCPGIEIEEVES